MAEVTISGNKKLKTLNKEFQENFPYLRLSFFSKEEWEAGRNGKSKIESISMEKRLSEVRTVPPSGEKEASIHGKTKIKNLEDNFAKQFGVHLQVCYNTKDGGRYFTSGKSDEMTLTEFNKECEKNQCIKNPV